MSSVPRSRDLSLDLARDIWFHQFRDQGKNFLKVLNLASREIYRLLLADPLIYSHESYNNTIIIKNSAYNYVALEGNV